MTDRDHARRRRPRRLLLKLAVSLTVTLVLAEAALHLVPALLPASFRGRYPLHGVGFFHPGLLDRTPVEAVPLPLYVGDHVGPPPADLVELGVAPPRAADADRARHGEIELRVDALGLPNDGIPEQADVVFVGDSFAVSAGVSSPPGLVRRFAEESGLSTYNLGIAAIGPLQERFLLREHGLPKAPRVVVWMFFGGNDVFDTATTLVHRSEGRASWGDVHADRRPPRLRLLALLRHLRGQRIDAELLPPVPGARLAASGEEVWFHPQYLRTLARSRGEWSSDPGYVATLEVLDEVVADVRAQGARLLFVYLPSKPQALLPTVAPDIEVLYEMAAYPEEELPIGPEDCFAAASANRGALEDLLREACEARAVAFLSATPPLEGAAREGRNGFLVADTHWSVVGHAELLPLLVESVQALLP